MHALDGDQLLQMFVRGAMGRAGRKSASRVVQVVGGKSRLLSASTLLAAAGVAWGLYETLQSQKASAATGSPGGGTPAPSPASGPPQRPGPPPPGPTAAGASAPAVPPEVARIVRLAVSAANADGTTSEPERAVMLQHARDAGVEALALEELAARRPLAEIVAGVTADVEKRDLYMLAFAIVRADEGVSGAERIYLAQLAHALGLSPEVVAAIERDTSAAIDAGPATG